MNSVPPDDFVETDIVIEENGYQDIRFTADGTVYEVLDLQLYNTDTASVPIFSYKTDGFLNSSQCGNYYAIENSQGFHLVSDSFGTLFCPIEEKESVIKYYTDIENLCGYYEDLEGREVALSDDDKKIMQIFLETDVNSLPKENIILTNAESFEIKLVCKEKLVHTKSHWFLVLNDTLYYIYDSDFAEDDAFWYTVKSYRTK